VEAFQVLEQENKNLRERVEELLNQLGSEDKGHAEETHRMKKEMFNLRMQLEQTFRKTLQELDAQSQRKAFDAMDDESKSALMANAKLKEELSLQSVGVENLLQRYQQIDDGFKKMKVDKSILEKNNDIQLQEIAGLKRHQYEYESRLSDMRQSMRTLNMERLQNEKQIQSMGEMLEDLKKYKALYAKSQARGTKWKTRALELSKKYISLEQERIDNEQQESLGRSLAQLSLTDSHTSVESVQQPLKSVRNGHKEGLDPRLQAISPTSSQNLPPYEGMMAIWNRNYSSSPGGINSHQTLGRSGSKPILGGGPNKLISKTIPRSLSAPRNLNAIDKAALNKSMENRFFVP